MFLGPDLLCNNCQGFRLVNTLSRYTANPLAYLALRGNPRYNARVFRGAISLYTYYSKVNNMAGTASPPVEAPEGQPKSEEEHPELTMGEPTTGEMTAEAGPAPATTEEADSKPAAATVPATTAPVAAPTANAQEEETTDGSTTAAAASSGLDEVNPADFKGEVASDNTIPSAETLRKVEGYTVLDRHGKTHTFKSLYSGPNSARRVLVIFIRHFFCGVGIVMRHTFPSRPFFFHRTTD